MIDTSIKGGLIKGMKDTPITGMNIGEETGTHTTTKGKITHTRGIHHFLTKANTTQGMKHTPIDAALEDLLIMGYWNTTGR